ncbi:EAL domain-containing protein [Sphingomonas sp. SORGH_AS_0879]|uniref:EAL domain-containing protein n=1 Tax=Sphingomonas sp. SORGH_AS_0879 TaxID=3041790 RepID=UPI00278B7C80|nr:EAL domain-containing protein [Sphingomonas sp. SORGH_AS_0879]MDQ1229763.1 EAL domain-containing protein (putative c-di-GMP-specific phosphodiesterase class I) [Sphingomonas sp. SORGH_AS_0879]
MNDSPSRIAASESGLPGPATGVTNAEAVDPHWQFLILLAVGNFTILRRRFGRVHCATLIELIVARLAEAFPEAMVRPTGAAEVEMMMFAPTRAVLEDRLAAMNALLSQPFELGGERCRVEPVLGAAAATVPHDDDIRLLEDAEQALADGHIEGRPVVREMAARADRLDRIALARDLSQAVEHDGLYVEYQPKVHVRQQRIASIEALLRWRHPVYGMISPMEFIPVAEESRVIAPLTLWTLRRVIADQQSLIRAGHDLRVYVNISGMLLSDQNFVREACALVTDSGARIGFEITETSVIRDPDSAIANLQTFVDMGITVAIDDYGAGLSSLSYLKQLPACELKIDKLFITQLTSSNRDPLIVRSTIDLAHALEMEVVAEGVETPAALALLSVMGCDMIQGYLISRPIGLEALTRFLTEQGHQATVAMARPTPFARLVANARG